MMPPNSLTADEEAFVDHWLQKAVYFMKISRRADVYLQSIPREVYLAAYREFTTSGRVIRGKWNNPDPNDKRSWQPRPEDREAYFQYIEDLIKNNPPTSPLSAVKAVFAANAAMTYIECSIVAEKPQQVRVEYSDKLYKLNRKDFKEVYGSRKARMANKNDTIGDPDEEPFVRLWPQPLDPAKAIPPSEWRQFERIGETYFFRDNDHTTGFAAFELLGVLVRKTGKFYEIRFEGAGGTSLIPEQTLLDMIEDGMWV